MPTKIVDGVEVELSPAEIEQRRVDAEKHALSRTPEALEQKRIDQATKILAASRDKAWAEVLADVTDTPLETIIAKFKNAFGK